jgi:hypothetical protein
MRAFGSGLPSSILYTLINALVAHYVFSLGSRISVPIWKSLSGLFQLTGGPAIKRILVQVMGREGCRTLNRDQRHGAASARSDGLLLVKKIPLSKNDLSTSAVNMSNFSHHA